MPKPTQFKAISLHIADRKIEVAGLARPGIKGQKIPDVLTYLHDHHYQDLVSLEDPAKNKETAYQLTQNPRLIYHQKYAVADFTPPSIKAMDYICNLVRNNALAGRKTAIHCAAGLGRTGSILAALKLKELLLALPPNELNATLNQKTQSIQLGEYAKGYRKDDTWPCTSLVKQAVDFIRSEGGFYNENYVENEDQIDRLNEYQTHLIQHILRERSALKQACQNENVRDVRQLIGAGATPTIEMFQTAYSAGNIEIMNALIEGGILLTPEMLASWPPPPDPSASLFAELNAAASSLEIHRNYFNQLAPTKQNNQKKADLSTLITQIKTLSSAWTNTCTPSEKEFNLLKKAVDTALVSGLANHRSLVRTTPGYRELAMATQVILNGIQFIFDNIIKVITRDTNPVHSEGLRALLHQPTPHSYSKVKAFKDKLQQLHPTNTQETAPLKDLTTAPAKK